MQYKIDEFSNFLRQDQSVMENVIFRGQQDEKIDKMSFSDNSCSLIYRC